jgi:hypothetical protein
MRKRPLPLARVYGLLEPGPVVLLTTPGTKRLYVSRNASRTSSGANISPGSPSVA